MSVDNMTLVMEKKLHNWLYNIIGLRFLFFLSIFSISMYGVAVSLYFVLFEKFGINDFFTTQMIPWTLNPISIFLFCFCMVLAYVIGPKIEKELQQGVC